MKDGSMLAFFEAPGLPERPSVGHPAYTLFDHIALQARDIEEVTRWHEWLTANKVDVIGPTNHNGLIYSIYFHDPNCLRLEITIPLDAEWNRHSERGRADLNAWCDTKATAGMEKCGVDEALVQLIQDTRERRKADLA
jgi:hypothetical protein